MLQFYVLAAQKEVFPKMSPSAQVSANHFVFPLLKVAELSCMK